MKFFIPLAIILSILFSGCHNEPETPKPRGYPRIEFPEKDYREANTGCPFTFNIPGYAEIEKDTSSYCWMNVFYKPYNARLYLSYKSFSGLPELYGLTEDSRELVYKHTVKAEEIQENIVYVNPSVAGKYYQIEGNTATAIQFHLTDSTGHFIKGSLYFKTKANRDSLQPVIDYLEADIKKMINTFEWK